MLCTGTVMYIVHAICVIVVHVILCTTHNTRRGVSVMYMVIGIGSVNLALGVNNHVVYIYIYIYIYM